MGINKELKERWEKFQEDCDTYVCCSTLNQIVNYIPLKMILKRERSKKLRLVNISYQEGESSSDQRISQRFQNKKWDENLLDTLEALTCKDEPFEDGWQEAFRADSGESPNKILLSRAFSQEGYLHEINRALQNQSGKYILWNLTGGQRQVLLAVKHFIEKPWENSGNQHMILYLEGNTNRIIVGYHDKELGWKYGEVEERYADSKLELNLHQVFGLAGYEISYDEAYDFTTEKWEDKRTDNPSERNKHCLSFYKHIYSESEEMRIALIKSNSSSDNFQKRLKKYSEDKEVKIDALIEMVEGKGEYLFGYLLEYMTEAVIIQELQSHRSLCKLCKSIYFNVRVSHKTKAKSKNPRRDSFCQLDMVLLMKSGQIVVFECKSGGMDSATGKAREYTAYELGGVYGKPVLVTPYLEADIDQAIYDKYKDLKPTKTLEAACRAGLDVCCLDTMRKDLEQIFQDLLHT